MTIEYRNREGQMYILANAMTGVKDILVEEQRVPGAYQCSYPSFLDMYRILARMQERTGIPITLMICTLADTQEERSFGPGTERGTEKGPPGQPESGERDRLEERMESFRKILADSIRSGDVYSRYSSRQYLVLLTDATQEQGQKIAARLERKWRERCGCQKGRIQFEIQQTESPGKEERGDDKERNLYRTHHQSGECYLAGSGYLA